MGCSLKVDRDEGGVRMEAWVSPGFGDLSNQKNGAAIKLNVDGGGGSRGRIRSAALDMFHLSCLLTAM